LKLLLDTHIWLWALLDPSRLTRRVARTLEDGKNELWLSPISVWELSILADKGRVVLDSEVEEWIAEAQQQAPLKEAPITNEIALETGAFELPHRDPADRFLIATARVLDLTLVTADRRLIESKKCAFLANR
jgi:PIN domain nuclease of toxin-antitoxin system